MAAVALQLVGLTFGYGAVPLFEGLDLVVHPGEVVAVTGRNGSGKSTLLKLSLGLLEPWRGEVRLFGEKVGRFRRWEWVGYMPQGTEGTLHRSFPASVWEVVAAGVGGPRWRRLRLSREARCRVADCLAAVGLEGLAGMPVGTLSGGQQRRVLLARALVNRPRLLVLDEPLAGVDAEGAAGLAGLLLRWCREGGTAVLVAGHGAGPLEAAADRVLCLEASRPARAFDPAGRGPSKGVLALV